MNNRESTFFQMVDRHAKTAFGCFLAEFFPCFDASYQLCFRGVGQPSDKPRAPWQYPAKYVRVSALQVEADGGFGFLSGEVKELLDRELKSVNWRSLSNAKIS